MSESPTPKRPAVFITVSLLVIPLIYFASLGPAVWLASRELLPEPMVDGLTQFYKPLAWANDNWSPLSDLIDLYLKLWLR